VADPNQAGPDWYQFTLDVLERKLEQQNSLKERIVTRAAFLLGASGLLASKVLDIGMKGLPPNPCLYACYVLLCVAILGCAGFALWTIWPRSFRSDPDPQKFLEGARNQAIPVVQERLVKSNVEIYGINSGILLRMSSGLRYGFVFLAVSLVLCFILAISILTFQGSSERGHTMTRMTSDPSKPDKSDDSDTTTSPTSAPPSEDQPRPIVAPDWSESIPLSVPPDSGQIRHGKKQ